MIFAGGFGTRDLNTGEPVNAQTAYLIGSSTKPFTVTAIAILAEEGVLDWDDTRTALTCHRSSSRTNMYPSISRSGTWAAIAPALSTNLNGWDRRSLVAR